MGQIYSTEEYLAKKFHEIYEAHAPQFGYETRKETAVAWDDIPYNNPNKALMIDVCKTLIRAGIVTVPIRFYDDGRKDLRR